MSEMVKNLFFITLSKFSVVVTKLILFGTVELFSFFFPSSLFLAKCKNQMSGNPVFVIFDIMKLQQEISDFLFNCH